MLKLFTNKETIRGNISIDPVFGFVKRTYKRELTKVTKYFRENEFTVKNQHILVRVLKSLSIDYNLDIYDYMAIATDRYPYVANNFNFSSGKKLGKILKSEIYGYNSLEVFISITDNNDLLDMVNNWKELEPVKVLRHNNRDLGLLLPDDKYDYDIPVLSIFSIDLPMLALQYRSWCLERRSIDNNNLSMPINLFIKQYVLPNMVKSQLEYTIINILSSLENTIKKADHKHPFPVIDYSTRLHKILINFYTSNSKKKTRYEDILKNIPSFSNDNLYSSMTLPRTLVNTQNRWSILLSRLLVMDYLFTYFPESERINKTTIKDTKLELKMLLRDKTLDKLLKGFMLEITTITIETIIE